MPTPDPAQYPKARGQLPPTTGGRPPALAGGPAGPGHLRPLLDTVLTALTEGATTRHGPIPPGGPAHVTARLRDAATPVLPETGSGAEEALHTLVRALAEGAADPAEPHCAAHLHCPPLALAVAADLAANALNPSLDSWDQAPAASALETDTAAALAALVYPQFPAPDAVLTTGGTDSNHLALLLARERARANGAPGVQTVCATTAHHSIHQAAWLLGLPEPVALPAPDGTLDPVTLDNALGRLHGPVIVVATAGTTDTGAIDPLPRIADIATAHAAELHIDACYGGPLLFSAHRRHQLDGIQSAASASLDLHKLGWQPIAAGLLAVPDTTAFRPLRTHADYLNAHDDTDAGFPDLLGRSLRTTRRPDILKIAVTLRALGRRGIGELVDHVCASAQRLADLIEHDPDLTLHARPTISTVLFRPAHATDADVAAIRRALIADGSAVLGRAHAAGRLWLKATLLNPATRPEHLASLLKAVTKTAPAAPTPAPMPTLTRTRMPTPMPTTTAQPEGNTLR